MMLVAIEQNYIAIPLPIVSTGDLRFVYVGG